MAELYLPPIRPKYNPTNGQFLKGNAPANKGRKWEEWMTEEGQRNARKGWKNLDIHRNKNGRPDTAGRCRKAVIAIWDDGHFRVYIDGKTASEKLGISRENIGLCCRLNASAKVKKHDWAPGQPKGTSPVNTDHRYMGIRFYFNSDINIWKSKIRKD